MMHLTELRDRREASAWVSTGLCLSRLVQIGSTELKLARRWILATLAECEALPPPGVIADVGQLLMGRRFHLRVDAPLDGVRLQNAVRRYEDYVLGRLVDDARMVAAVDAVARLKEEDRASAVGYLAAVLSRRLGKGAGVSVNQGMIRQLSKRSVEEITGEGLVCLGSECDAVDLLAEGYELLTQTAEERMSLITEVDVFTLENLLDLGGLSQRMAVGQAVEAAQWLGTEMPEVIRAKRVEIGDVPTGMEDESTYPTGGFSSVTTVGSPENIVTSEFMYMERRDSDEAFDLFDLRYAEGELLYYTRDETVLVRKRRQIYLAISDSLVAARVKDDNAQWQRIVVLLGMIRLVVQRVSELLGREDLAVDVVFLETPDRPGANSLFPEMRLCSLLLREWSEVGLAHVWSGTLKELVSHASVASKKALVQVVLCDLDDLSESWNECEPPPGASSVSLLLGKNDPQLVLNQGDRENPQGWFPTTQALLETLWSG